MKQVLSKILVTSGVAMGLVMSTSSFAAKPDIKTGEELYANGDMSRGILACVACHGVAGNSMIPMYPSLAGMPYEYIVNQLKNFQTPEGAKASNRTDAQGNPTMMDPTVAQMTPQDMQNLAIYISQQSLNQPATAKLGADLNVVQRGREIWRAGIADRNVPACASCHGATGKGMPSAFPALSGQHPEYLEAQLLAFADGYRKNGGTENMMGEIANRMNRADMKAVADYAAGIR
ncbi:MAG: c-type cytochrome [Advenella sp.]|nr:c-type cytochrome [Advenella sp.]